MKKLPLLLLIGSVLFQTSVSAWSPIHIIQYTSPTIFEYIIVPFIILIATLSVPLYLVRNGKKIYKYTILGIAAFFTIFIISNFFYQNTAYQYCVSKNNYDRSTPPPGSENRRRIAPPKNPSKSLGSIFSILPFIGHYNKGNICKPFLKINDSIGENLMTKTKSGHDFKIDF